MNALGQPLNLSVFRGNELAEIFDTLQFNVHQALHMDAWNS
jgi:hypothetical protein